MGQVALGFRSLLIKLTIFFVMAVLLAWALGGTLWPRAEIVDDELVVVGQRAWFWRLVAGGREINTMHWVLMQRDHGEEEKPFDGRRWYRVAPITIADDGIYYAGNASVASSAPWSIERVDADGVATSHPMPDRLAVERQLARIRAGFPIQDKQLIHALRPRVLDPPAPSTTADDE